MATTAEQITRIRAVMGRIEGAEQTEADLTRIASGFDRLDLAARRFSQNLTRGDTGFDRLMRSYGDAAAATATRVEREYERIVRSFTAGRFEPIGGIDAALKTIDTMVAKLVGVGPAAQQASAALRAALPGGTGALDAFSTAKGAIENDADFAKRSAAVASLQALERGMTPAARAAERFVVQWKTVNDALAAEPALAERARAALAGIAGEQFTGAGRNTSTQRAQTVAQAAQGALGAPGGEEQVRKAALDAAKGVQELETSHKAGSTAARLYAIQLVQTASSLQAGMPLMTTLVQQGHQVVDIFLATGGKMSDIGAIARGLAGALFSVPGAFAAIAAGVGIAAYAITNAQQRMVDLRDGLRLYTSDFVTSAERIRSNTSSLLPQLPGQSKAELDQIQQSFLRLRPDLSDTQLQALTKDASALAKVLGGDLKEAGRLMSQGLTDPAKLADELAKQHLPGMTEALRNNIAEMQRSGQYGQAQAKVFELLRNATKGTQSDVTTATSVWHGLTEEWRKFADQMAGPLDTISQKLASFFELQVRGARRMAEGLGVTISRLEELGRKGGAASGLQGGGIGALDEYGRAYDPGQIAGRGRSARTDPAISPGGAGSPVKVGDGGDAIGMFQLHTPAAHDVGLSPTDRYDYNQNIYGGVAYYLKQLRGQGGDIDAATRAYNEGAGNLNSAKGYRYQRDVTGQSLTKLDPKVNADIDAIIDGNFRGVSDAVRIRIKQIALQESAGQHFDANGRLAPAAADLVSPRERSANAFPSLPPGFVPPGVTQRNDGSFSRDVDRASRTNDVEMTNTPAQDFRQAQEALGRYRQSGAAGDIPLAREALQQQIDAWERYRQQFAEGTKEARDAAQAQRQLRGELYDTITPMDRIHREEQLRLNTTQELDPAARRLAEANQNLGETARRSGDADASAADKARTRQNVMRELNLQIAQTLHDNDQQIAANDRMASSYERGSAAVQSAENRERAIAEVRKAGLDPLKEGAAQVDRLTASYGRLTAQQAQAASGSNIFQARQQLSTVQLETSLVGHSQAETNQALAANRVLQSPEALMLGPDDPSIQRQVDYAKQVAAANDNLNLMKQSWSEIEQTGSRALDTLQQGLEKAFHTGKIKDFATAALQMLQDIGMEGLKLSLMNPLKNWLFGTNTPTIGSVGQAAGGAGGAIGGLTKWLFGSSDKSGGGATNAAGSGLSGVSNGISSGSQGALSRLWNWITGGSSDNGSSSSSPFDAAGGNFDLGSGFGSGSADSAFDAPGFGRFHSGGTVGAGIRGGLPASVWAGASRFHAGTDLSDDPDAPTGADEYGALGWFGANRQNVGGVDTQAEMSAENQDRGPGSVLMTAVSSFVSAFASKAFGSALSSVGNQMASGVNWAGGQFSGAASGSTGYDWFGNVGKGYYGPPMANAHQFHIGGLVGAQGGLNVPASVFDDADRFHTGWAGARGRRSPAAQLYLAHDEVPAILQKGEVVLTQAQQQRVGRRRIASVLHQGGYATGTYGPSFPESVWQDAPRFHAGGEITDSISLPNTLAPPTPTMPATARMGGSRSGDRVVIHAPINVNGVKNVQDFANSQQQIRAMAARAIGRAQRSL